MLRRAWLIILTCALIVGPVLSGLEVIPGAVAWLLCLGCAALIVATLVLGEQTRRRASKAPAGLLQNCSRALTAAEVNEQSGPIAPFTR
jgi:hypothetical protein